MSKQEEKDLSQKIMQEIERRHVSMRPRFYFILASLLLGTGLAGAIISTITFLAVATFRLRTYSTFGFLRFGYLGLRPFFLTFPWLPLLIAIIGLGSGIWLVKKYDISYRRSFLGLTAGIVALVLIIGSSIGQFVIKEEIQSPQLSRFLHQRQTVGQNWIVGRVTGLQDNQISITTPTGEETIIIWDDATRFPRGNDIVIGQRIRAIGEWENDTFKAEGIGNGHNKGGQRPRRFRRSIP